MPTRTTGWGPIRLDALRPIDDVFMRVIFQGQAELARHAVRLFLGKPDLELDEFETQRDVKRLAGAKSCELDLWARDSEGVLYDIEVQAGAGPDPKRLRYYSAAMDVEALGSGADHSRLPEQWVICVTERDPFGEGRPTYRFAMADERGGRALGDGRHVLYANASCAGEGPLVDFLHDFLEAEPDKMRDNLLRERVHSLKASEKGRKEMGSMVEMLRAEGRAEGRIEGRTEGRAEGRAEGEERALLSSAGALMRKLNVSARRRSTCSTRLRRPGRATSRSSRDGETDFRRLDQLPMSIRQNPYLWCGTGAESCA